MVSDHALAYGSLEAPPDMTELLDQLSDGWPVRRGHRDPMALLRRLAACGWPSRWPAGQARR